MLITWFKFLIIAKIAAETAGIYDLANEIHDPSLEGRTSKTFNLRHCDLETRPFDEITALNGHRMRIF